MARTSQVILAKGIRLDRQHKNVLNYSESDMLSLVNGNTHKVTSVSTCSFLRNQNAIEVQIPYGTALQANYMAFQNPSYSNKWFFAFIDEVEYRSNSNTIIRYTVDDHATWFDNWSLTKSFVIREHANTDVAGDNLIPENFELGEYVINGARLPLNSILLRNHVWYCMISSYSPAGVQWIGVNAGGIALGGGLFVFKQWQNLANALTKMAQDSHLDAVSQVYCLSPDFFDPNDLEFKNDIYPTGAEDPDAWTYYVFTGRDQPFFKENSDNSWARPASLNGYTPVNQKLLTAPFMSFILTNNSGSVNSYAYEYFSDVTNIQFRTAATPTVGGSSFIYPLNYKGIGANKNEGLVGGKFPTCSWSGDAFTNWLTSNAVNIGIGVISDGIGLVKSITGGAAQYEGASGKNISSQAAGAVNNVVGSVVDTGLSIANRMAEIYQHSLVARTVQGNTNCGDVMSGFSENNNILYHLSITAQFAERIDQYFTRFGYATNKLKLPNLTGRAYWNYVQIAAGECIGYPKNTGISAPSDAMDRINNDYRSGVTVWHNHENIGNYDLANTIVS